MYNINLFVFFTGKCQINERSISVIEMAEIFQKFQNIVLFYLRDRCIEHIIMMDKFTWFLYGLQEDYIAMSLR